MHIAEVVTIAKSLPLLRLNTYKSLILSYSADYRRIFAKNSTNNDLIELLLTGHHHKCNSDQRYKYTYNNIQG